jgi:glucosylceramidase
VKYIQEMAAEGIPVDAVTPQNEPLYWTAGYPCMEMQPGEQLAFIRDYLGPRLATAGISTKIIIYDHNWDNTQYAISILNDSAAKNFIAGSAFHAYAGDVSAMSTVHYAHPGKDLYFTEISGGTWATDFADNLMWNMRNIFIGTMQNWSRTALLWNLVLDENYGPQNNGCPNCRGVVTFNTGTLQVLRNVEYYSIGHFSKFVRPGAVRIAAPIPQDLSNMGVVAFLNMDGSKVLIACNYADAFGTFTVRHNDTYFSYSVPPESVATLVW